MAIKKEIELIANTDKATKNVDGFGKSIEKVNEDTLETNNSLDKLSGGSVSSFSKMKGSVSSVITSFKSLKFAIAATGIGALVIGIVAVKEAFTASEEGQNKFAKIMGIIGSVTGNFLDLLSDAGEKIIETFENPKQALMDFWQALKQNVVNRFVGLVEFIPKVGKVIQQLWNRDFAGASETATNAIAKVTLGIDDAVGKTQELINKTKEYSKELQSDAEAAGRIADKRAKADKIERDLIVQRAKANRDIADLREKAADKDNFTSQQRIAFLKEAGQINEDITNQEIKAAQLRRDAIIEENTLSKSNKDDLKAEEEAKARVIELDTQRLNLQKRLTAEITSASREGKTEEEKKAEDTTKKEREAEIKRQEELQKVKDDYAKKLEDQQADTELKKIELEQQRALAEVERLKGTEQDKLDIIAFYDKKRLAISNKTDKDTYKSAKELEQGKKTLLNDSVSLLGQVAKKNKAIQKGVALANTFTGVTEVWRSPSTLPEPLATANKVVSTGIVLASGLSAVNNIGGSGSANTSVSEQVSAPSFNLIGSTREGAIAEASTSNTQPIKAYVVSKEISSEQELDRNIEGSASIG